MVTIYADDYLDVCFKSLLCTSRDYSDRGLEAAGVVRSAAVVTGISNVSERRCRALLSPSGDYRVTMKA